MGKLAPVETAVRPLAKLSADEPVPPVRLAAGGD